MIRYLVFDFDGTLADTQQLFIETYNTIAFRKNYRAIEGNTIAELKKMTITERCRYLGVPLYKVPFMGIEFLKEYSNSITKMQLMGGIREMLQDLRKMGYNLAIVSSNSRENIQRFLAHHDITEFTAIHCSSNILGKTRLLQRFMKANNLKANELVYIGDEQRDVLASKEARVKVAAVTWGYDAVESLAALSPDHLIHTPEDVVKLFEPAEIG